MTELTFLRPAVFLIGLPLILLTVLLCYLNFRSRVDARARYGAGKLIDSFSRGISGRQERLLALGWTLVMALLVVASAGPIIPDAPVRAEKGSLQVVIVSDVSNSMRAEDYRVQMPPKDGVPPTMVKGPYGSRLDMVKSVIINEIMPAVAGNKMGIATYKGDGFQQADLTDDFTALQWIMVHWFNVGDAPGQGSNVAAGLSTALTIFGKDKTSEQQRVIVLFSDGGFTDKPEDITAVEDKIRQSGIRFIVVGVGSTQPQQVPFWADGKPNYAVDKSGQILTTAINETALEHLANAMGGQYVHITGGILDINWALQLAGSATEQQAADIFYIPLGLAVLILTMIRARGLRGSKRNVPINQFDRLAS